MNTPNLEFLKPASSIDLNTKIPVPTSGIPDPSFLKKELAPIPSIRNYGQGEFRKHEKEFDEFCRWSALPKSERRPKSAIAFERKYGLPLHYTNQFRMREEYQQKRQFYFWEWAMDLWPDFVEAVYKRAVKDSAPDARIFAELMTKKIDMDKPQVNVAPMVIVGVDQDKINKLFTPKTIETVDKSNVVEGKAMK